MTITPYIKADAPSPITWWTLHVDDDIIAHCRDTADMIVIDYYNDSASSIAITDFDQSLITEYMALCRDVNFAPLRADQRDVILQCIITPALDQLAQPA